jgi:HAD superfamily hydrolase (TIGR01509 family)
MRTHHETAGAPAQPSQPEQPGPPGPLNQIAAVCFDLDGTLVDSEGEAADAIDLALRPLGRQLSAVERDFVVGHGFVEIYKYIYSHGGLPLDINQFEAAVFDARLQLFADHGAGELPGARTTVRWAAERYPLALVTGSTRREAELMLRALGISDCFQLTLCAGEYPKGKPSPGPYLQAAAALRVPPERCLALEDSTAGITSACSAGMLCVAVRIGNRYGQDQSGAPLAIETLLDLPALLAAS